MASAAPAPAPLQFLRVERKPGGYALVLLCHEPVNTMGLAVWRELAATLAQLEGEQPAVRGVVFASGVTRDVFSAGNNINELYAPLTSKERYRCGGGGGWGGAGARGGGEANVSFCPTGGCSQYTRHCGLLVLQGVLGGEQPLPGSPLRLAARHGGRHPRWVRGCVHGAGEMSSLLCQDAETSQCTTPP